ncbi:hypothetical protein EDF56_106141 [Novosphingobium sp. PhB165]|nr:hypothetical protein EDF56_106141 [Novosphingobium sp. PhB165]
MVVPAFLFQPFIKPSRTRRGLTIGTVSIVLITAISSSGEGLRRDDLLVEQYVDEDDHDQRLGLEHPADDRGFALLPAEQLSGEVNAAQLADHRGDKEQQRRADHHHAAHSPVRAQAGAEEEHRHHREQQEFAETIELLAREPVGIEYHARQERADHEVQAGPVCREAHQGQPDQRDIPAVFLADALEQGADDEGGDGEGDEEQALTANALPVDEDEGQHTPDRNVVQAGIAQQALAERLAEDAQLFHQQYQDRQRGNRAGHADAEYGLRISALGPDPAGGLEQQGGGDRAKQQRRE